MFFSAVSNLSSIVFVDEAYKTLTLDANIEELLLKLALTERITGFHFVRAFNRFFNSTKKFGFEKSTLLPLKFIATVATPNSSNARPE